MTGKGSRKTGGGKAKRGGKPRTGAKVEVPSSGPAEEVLGTAGRPAGGGKKKAPAPAAAPAGPERVYAFTDSLDHAGEDSTEPKEQAEVWVTFGLGKETFAFPVSRMREVVRVESLTRVPHAPFPVRGITNLRGRVLPVVDLRVRLELPPAEVSSISRVLVVDSRGRTLGLLVDRVEKVVQILPSGVEAPPADVMTEQSEYLLGVYNLEGDGLVILLDIDKVLLIREPREAGAGRASGPE